MKLKLTESKLREMVRDILKERIDVELEDNLYKAIKQFVVDSVIEEFGEQGLSEYSDEIIAATDELEFLVKDEFETVWDKQF